MEDDKTLKRMISEAEELTQIIVAQKDKILKMITSGNNTYSEESKLDNMIGQMGILTSRITDMQNTLFKSKELEITEQQQIQNKPKIRGLVQPSKKIKKIKTKDLLDDIKIENKYQGFEQIKRKQNEFTVNQIEAAGLSGDYLNTISAKKMNLQDDSDKNKFRCIRHPWIQAYEICNYCHKPFCFEDIVENNGGFFCVEDVDKTPLSKNKAYHKYSSLSMVSGITLMFEFVLFIYFGYSQLSYQTTNIINMIQSTGKGIGVLLSFTNFVSIFPILGFILTFIGLIIGIMVLINTRKSFVMGIVVSVVLVILFSYSYITYLRVYTLIISVISFISMVTLLLSKGVEYIETEEEELDYSHVNLSNIVTY